jgi:hypothetical protein
MTVASANSGPDHLEWMATPDLTPVFSRSRCLRGRFTPVRMTSCLNKAYAPGARATLSVLLLVYVVTIAARVNGAKIQSTIILS